MAHEVARAVAGGKGRVRWGGERRGRGRRRERDALQVEAGGEALGDVAGEHDAAHVVVPGSCPRHLVELVEEVGRECIDGRACESEDEDAVGREGGLDEGSSVGGRHGVWDERESRRRGRPRAGPGLASILDPLSHRAASLWAQQHSTSARRGPHPPHSNPQPGPARRHRLIARRPRPLSSTWRTRSQDSPRSPDRLSDLPSARQQKRSSR